MCLNKKDVIRQGVMRENICYLEWVKAGDDSSIFHMAAPRGVGKLALGIRARAGASLKLTTHFQGQPFGVPSHGHIDSHQRCSQALRSGGGRWMENCLMSTRVTNSDARKKSPEKHRGNRSKKNVQFFPSANRKQVIVIGVFLGMFISSSWEMWQLKFR